jgi:hypothetical protein
MLLNRFFFGIRNRFLGIFHMLGEEEELALMTFFNIFRDFGKGFGVLASRGQYGA